MATKTELEDELASANKQIAKLEKKLEAPKEVVEVEKVVEVPVVALSVPPTESGQMYVESHPILGVTKKAHVVSQSVGDGRIGDGAEIVR